MCLDRPSPANAYQSSHAQLLLSSFQQFVGRPLIADGLPAVEAAEALFRARFVVVSHNAAPDPVLTYGNEAALKLWETDWDTLVGMPSRLTAEPIHQEERARLLQATEQQGYIDNYTGIRISATGRRFRITGALIWTLLDDQGRWVGQAATFRQVAYLELAGF